MTLREALESKQPFKRPHWQTWEHADGNTSKIYISSHSGGSGGILPTMYPHQFPTVRKWLDDDVLADDYMIQEKTVTITGKQLYDAWIALQDEDQDDFFDKLKKGLGL